MTVHRARELQAFAPGQYTERAGETLLEWPGDVDHPSWWRSAYREEPALSGVGASSISLTLRVVAQLSYDL